MFQNDCFEKEAEKTHFSGGTLPSRRWMTVWVFWCCNLGNHYANLEENMERCKCLSPINVDCERSSKLYGNWSKKYEGRTGVFPSVNHITCYVHAINLVCKSIGEHFTLVSMLIIQTKKWFRKASTRKRAFRDLTEIPLSPFPITIRFGSWLNCVK